MKTKELPRSYSNTFCLLVFFLWISAADSRKHFKLIMDMQRENEEEGIEKGS